MCDLQNVVTTRSDVIIIFKLRIIIIILNQNLAELIRTEDKLYLSRIELDGLNQLESIIIHQD